MTLLKVSGIKTVRANGAVYRYHRGTGKRLKANPDTHPQVFLEEVAARDAELAAQVAIDPSPVALGGLFALYRASPEFLQLEQVTRTSYQRSFDVLQTFDAKPLHLIDQPWVLKVRDTVFEKRGRWQANQVVAVLSIVLGWGVPRGHTKLNAAAGVPKIRRPKNKGVANKAWRPAEVEIFMTAARETLKVGASGLRKAVALAYYAGLRKADVVRAPKSARRGGAIDMDMISKSGRELSIFEAKRLTAILDEPDVFQWGKAAKKNGRKIGNTIVLNRLGVPYTENGLDSTFDKLKRTLAKEGKIRPGLTFHGLRKSLGTAAADMGFSETDIAGALGQANGASARPYVLEASRKRGAQRVFKALSGRK